MKAAIEAQRAGRRSDKRIRDLRLCPECGVYFTLGVRCKYCRGRRQAALHAQSEADLEAACRTLDAEQLRQMTASAVHEPTSTPDCVEVMSGKRKARP